MIGPMTPVYNDDEWGDGRLLGWWATDSRGVLRFHRCLGTIIPASVTTAREPWRA